MKAGGKAGGKERLKKKKGSLSGFEGQRERGEGGGEETEWEGWEYAFPWWVGRVVSGVIVEEGVVLRRWKNINLEGDLVIDKI